ncbi:MAG: tetratricopeptide repeat protein, partial [Myxococcales bacterium]|nr:tetratricopeptide repeat protein [Myxococcales bacterium]
MKRVILATLFALVGVSAASAQDTTTPEASTTEATTTGANTDAATPAEGADTATTTAESTQPAANTPVPLPSFLDTTDRRIVDDRPPPSAAQVAALKELEQEMAGFARAGTAYDNAVGSIVRREYLRTRRQKDEVYSAQIAEEEKHLIKAREDAITLFEHFIDRYPNDPTYTPDAMFRLGELYFERSYERFYAQQGGALQTNTPDFTATIDLYHQLVTRFPNYARIDGVFYLIGYCLNEMGKADEARMAWLNLVCANNFKYDPAAMAAAAAAAAQESAGEGDDASKAHPALALDAKAEISAAGIHVDPYKECTPVIENAKFLSETWFRIGEYHFDDYGGDHSVELSISAYSHILSDPTDRNYSLALYKVAWAYYRASQYPEAIQRFGQLVQYSDDEQKRTGEEGSQLRPEAVQYLGIAFAYDDWN